ncbi:penicillin-binding protein 1C [Helicobacter sp. 16-1353]|nr:penicillin-binding protein 1C [Helicobacter sp. 16-1353]
MKNKILIFLITIISLLLAYFAFIFFSFNPKGDPFESRYSKTMLDRNNEILSIFLNKDEQWHLKNTANLSDKLKIATLTFEDKNFYSHLGFDPIALIRSLYINIKYKRKVGGSTISMQTIKLLQKNKRTYFNKIKEIILSLRLESLYSKDEILEMYLNNAPYGGNIVGVSAASLMYFNKSTENLTWAESALLAVLPNAPGLIHLKKNNDILIQKRNKLLQKLRDKQYIDDDNLKLSMSEKLPTIKRDRNLASHLALRFPQQSIIISTIDKNIQIILEERLKSYHKKLLNLGINNLAGMIIDTQTSEVLGYAGSQDFFDIEGFGQIDGIIAKRSPGSILKPLLYALAIDDGLIAPQSKLVDAPTFFSNFKPQNASKKYYGLISARESLIKSLNIPFVGLLQDYGYDKFFFKLKDILGFSDNNFERYGLSLILGTKELSIEDIARIYVGLGNYGEFGNIYYTKDSTKNPKKRLLSKGSAYLTLDAMRYLERMGLENRFINKKIFSWKTGTSYGRKDAWAAGTSPKYTIVVWSGNFSGESNPNLFGLNITGELLFNILNDLGDVGGEFDKPNDLKEITLDSPSGYRYNEEYKHIKSFKAIYPKMAKPLRYSPFLHNVFINKDKKEVNSLDVDFINAEEITKIVLPLSLLEYYKEQNIEIKKQTKSLQILYPKNHLSIILTKDFEGENELIVRIANINNGNVWWYLNKDYIGMDNKTTKTLRLKAGFYTLSVINDNGDSDSVNFTISK